LFLKEQIKGIIISKRVQQVTRRGEGGSTESGDSWGGGRGQLDVESAHDGVYDETGAL
jgi:hypothetical protein